MNWEKAAAYAQGQANIYKSNANVLVQQGHWNQAREQLSLAIFAELFANSIRAGLAPDETATKQ